MAIVVYLLKTSVVFTVLFSLYNIFLKNVTFLRLRRWYLHVTLVLSFLIPWISSQLLPHYYTYPTSFLVWLNSHITQYTTWLTHPWINQVVYMAVIIALAINFIWVTIRYLFNLIKTRRFLHDGTVILKTKQYTLKTGNKGNGSFCFLRTIYLHHSSISEQNIHIIIEHEKAHIRQFHFIDMWLIALCDYFFWLYPFIKRFQKEWEEVLECLADQNAIDTLHIQPIAYQTALYASMEYAYMQSMLSSAFGRSLIAQRLQFLSRKPSCSKIIPFKLFLPFAIACILTFSLAFVDSQIYQLYKINHICQAGYNPDEVTTGYVFDTKTGKPIGNAIIQSGQEGTVTVTDNDGFFFIQKAATSNINIQHIAYEDVSIKTASENLMIKLHPSMLTMAEERQRQHRDAKILGRKISEASFLSGYKSFQDYVSHNMLYPEKALIDKINGTVWVSAEIAVDGDVKNVKIHQGVNTELNKEAIRLVKNMPNWNPAIQNNVRTKVQVLIPISFVL